MNYVLGGAACACGDVSMVAAVEDKIGADFFENKGRNQNCGEFMDHSRRGLGSPMDRK